MPGSQIASHTMSGQIIHAENCPEFHICLAVHAKCDTAMESSLLWEGKSGSNLTFFVNKKAFSETLSVRCPVLGPEELQIFNGGQWELVQFC